MTNETLQELTVKEKYEYCKGFECPRLRSLMEKQKDGTPYFVEGDMAYYAMTLCNNWTIGLSDGDCPVKSVEAVVVES